MVLTAEGQKQFQKLTKKSAIVKGLAILFDRKLLTAPVINSEIRGVSHPLIGPANFNEVTLLDDKADDHFRLMCSAGSSS